MKHSFSLNKKIFFLIIVCGFAFSTILKGQTYTVTASWPQFGVAPCSSYRVDLQGSCGTTFSACCISSGLSLPSVGKVYTWNGSYLETTGTNSYGNAYQNLELPGGATPPCESASCGDPTSAGSISATDVCGTSVSVSGTAASGGTSPYEYRFYVNGAYVTSWSTSTSATITLPAGSTNNSITRYARATCSSTTGISTATIYVDAISNYTNGGTITGDEENCGSFDPATITSSSSPSGGSGGSPEYQWQSSANNSTWSDISGATSTTYNPTTITTTQYYRRKARRNPCTSWVYSNTVIKTVVVNYTSGGTITGDEENCNNFDPTTITSSTAASGGSGGTLAYQWQENTGSGWTNISGATSATYNPTSISQTTQYRRAARRSPCSTFVYSNTITKTIIGAPNVTNITVTNEICNNNNGTITFTFTNNPNRTTIAFSINGGATYPYTSPDNAGSYTITGLTAGTYNLYTRWGSTNDCPVNLSSQTINNSGGLTVVTSADTTLCGSEPTNLTLTATAANGTLPYTYSWDNGLGSGQTHTVSPTSTTTYTVTVTDNGGCTATKQVTATVKTNPLVTIATTNPNCGANNGTITFTFPNHPTETQLEFSFDGGVTYQLPVADNMGSITYSNRSAGIYEIWTRWGNDDCPIKLGVVTLSNIANLKVAIMHDKYVCLSNSTTLNAVVLNGAGGYSYTWFNGLGNSASITLTPSLTSNYTVQVVDANGCVAYETVSVATDPCGEICNNGIDDDGDGFIDCMDGECQLGNIAEIIHDK